MHACKIHCTCLRNMLTLMGMRMYVGVVWACANVGMRQMFVCTCVCVYVCIHHSIYYSMY